jgi:hypothetical protein
MPALGGHIGADARSGQSRRCRAVALEDFDLGRAAGLFRRAATGFRVDRRKLPEYDA